MIGADFISNEIKANGLCPNTFACAKSINLCVEKMEMASGGAPINQRCLKVLGK